MSSAMNQSSENAHPSPSKVDLAKFARERKAFKPMSDGERLLDATNVDDSTKVQQLVSPPPEETLSFRRTSRSAPSLLPNTGSSSKRKRIATLNPHQSEQYIPEKSQQAEATPNPKPRKQTRRQPRQDDSPTRPSSREVSLTPAALMSRVLFIKSPHESNPDADYAPPISSTVPRRSTTRTRRTTPIPPYDPPKDVFTSPREVFMTPTVSKSSKSKSSKNAKGKQALKIAIPVVKKELPDIDLNAPMPPPSPTDDPLLLSGPILPPTSTPTRPPSRKEAAVETTASLTSSRALSPLSPSSPAEDEAGPPRPTDWIREGHLDGFTDSSMFSLRDEGESDATPFPMLNFDDLPPSSDMSDSENEASRLSPTGQGNDEVEEGQGEYTGKWRMIKIPTKTDPPSSATRHRMEEWGRPITPFPMEKIKRLELLPDVDEENEDGDLPTQNEDEQEEDEVREMSLPLNDEEEEEEEREVREMSIPLEDNLDGMQDIDDVAPSPVVFPARERGPFDFDESFEDEETAAQLPMQLDVASQVANIQDGPPIDISQQSWTEALSQEVSQARLSLQPLQCDPSYSGLPDVQEYQVDDLVHEAEVLHDIQIDSVDVNDGSSDGEDDLDPEVVKITSADPRAAARAAAILKQHRYDCFTKITTGQQRVRERSSSSHFDDYAKELRRKGLSNCGITKSDRIRDRKRQPTSGIGVMGDRVIIPGSPATTLPDLLREAEAEVVSWTPTKPPRDPYRTPPPPNRVRSKIEAIAATDYSRPGERAWTKDEWRLLDSCFTDERLYAGQGLDFVEENGLAPVDCVRAEDVVDRFVQVIGSTMLETFGESWSWEHLLQRVKALQNKQRSGRIAPPTTPFTPSPDARTHRTRRIPSMEVPDFTPIGRHSPPPKELVSLRPAPLPEKPTMIPRPKPQRLVQLHPPRLPTLSPIEVPRPRRSSGSSVKDLIKNFEELGTERKAELRRMMRTCLKQSTAGRPAWRL